jgi:hypothetical protein
MSNLGNSGEGEKQSTPDSEKAPVEADRAFPSTSSINGPPGFSSLPSFSFHPPMETDLEGSPVNELPTLRPLPPNRAWDPMPTMGGPVYDGPAYTCQARTTITQFETPDFNAPANVQEQSFLPSLSIPSLTPSPPPGHSATRLWDTRHSPYPNNRDRPRATNLNIARSLRETEPNRTSPSLMPTASSEFTRATSSPDYHGRPTWHIPLSTISRGGHSTNQDYTYSGTTSDGSMQTGVLEPSSSRLESLSCESEVGPSGERVEYDAVRIPAGRYVGPRISP